MGLSQSEVYEVATFYAHFDVVGDRNAVPPGVTVRVCDSVTCALVGGARLLKELSAKEFEGVRVIRAPCMGRCECAPVAAIGQNQVDYATVSSVEYGIIKGLRSSRTPKYLKFEDYESAGGYNLLRE